MAAPERLFASIGVQGAPGVRLILRKTTDPSWSVVIPLADIGYAAELASIINERILVEEIAEADPHVVRTPAALGLPDVRPDTCRTALMERGEPYPKSGCKVCRNGGLYGCPYETPRTESRSEPSSPSANDAYPV